MRRILSYVVFCFVAGLAASCSVPLDQAVIGRYHGDADLRGLDPSLKEYAQKAMTGARSALLEIKPGGRASFSGVGKPIEGDWKLVGTTLTVTSRNQLGSLKFQVKEDAQRLVPLLDNGQEKSLGGAKFWFNKE